MNICVIIPAHNESCTIGYLVESLAKKKFDILVIDDGSEDETGPIAREKGAVLIRHDAKQGKGYSLREGFRYALDHGYEVVVTIDGDGQHDVNDLPAMIRPILDGEAEISISGKKYSLKQGDFIIMPANKPHAVKALSKFKMLLTMIRA